MSFLILQHLSGIDRVHCYIQKTVTKSLLSQFYVYKVSIVNLVTKETLVAINPITLQQTWQIIGKKNYERFNRTRKTKQSKRTSKST